MRNLLIIFFLIPTITYSQLMITTHFLERTDTKKEISISYIGILPDLFKEGQGVVVEGKLVNSSLFKASEVLAKHDENYMPPQIQKKTLTVD